METIFAADVGGTTVRLAVFQGSDLTTPVFRKSYPSAAYDGLTSVIRLFLEEMGSAGVPTEFSGAGMGIAGPVEPNVARMTNLPWVIERGELEALLKVERVIFLNDFAAVCNAVPHLLPEQKSQLGGGSPQPESSIAVLGAGTGLGEGLLVWNGEDYLTVASEGGNTDFAPRGALQARLCVFLEGDFGRVSWERIVSGPGLVNLYRFLRDSEGVPESGNVRDEMATGDPAAVISAHGLAHTDPLCDQVLDLFCACYGAAAGNLALTSLGSGGVYLAGGVTQKILGRIAAGGFRKAFEGNDQFADFLARVPVFAITHPDPGLFGAALAAASTKG